MANNQSKRAAPRHAHTSTQIVFHGIAHSGVVESHVRERVARLEHLHPELMRRHVTIEQAHRHKQQGKRFNVRLSPHVPGDEIVVDKGFDEDVYVALRDAFDSAR